MTTPLYARGPEIADSFWHTIGTHAGNLAWTYGPWLLVALAIYGFWAACRHHDKSGGAR